MPSATDDDAVDDPAVDAAAVAELARLRALVGPSEVDYEALRVDRDEAQAVARNALAETGELRGTIQEMRVQLARARQDQDILLRRAEMSTPRRTLDRVVSRWRGSVAPRAQRLLGRFRSS